MDNSAKTKELIMYVADRLKGNENYGATLLNKALYFIDNLNYLQTREPISSLKYIRQEHGATPKPSQFLAIRQSLIDNDEMEEVKSEFFGRVQKKYFPLREPNIDFFNKDEIVLIDKVLAALSGHNATSISNFSHQFMAWKITNNMDELPFFTFLLTSRMPSDDDILWAKEKMAAYLN